MDRIETPDILRILGPIWLVKAEISRRVQQRIGTVLDWAKTAGFRTGGNPIVGVGKGLPKQNKSSKHHAALPYAEVPGFVSRLRASDQGKIVKLAFEFAILTAARTGEVLEAEWREINDTEALWLVPAARMKAKREHRVPLSSRAQKILQQALGLSADGSLIFPGRS